MRYPLVVIGVDVCFPCRSRLTICIWLPLLTAERAYCAHAQMITPRLLRSSTGGFTLGIVRPAHANYTKRILRSNVHTQY
eukprot:6184902-Pleurochrysis_carterae.AAC.3